MLPTNELKTLAVAALEDLKAQDITLLDVSDVSTVTDYMIIASGTSSRHVKAVANNVMEKAKQHGHKPLGLEGETNAEWVLVDLGDVVVHVMLPAVRDFYQLEKLWTRLEEYRTAVS